MKKKFNGKIFKYFFVGTQIATTVFVSTLIGYQIDVFCKHNTYIITVAFSALSIFYALYALIQDVNKQK